MEFIEFNANPKNKRTGDCVVRAIALALNVSWYDAMYSLFNTSIKSCYSLASKENYTKLLKELGYEMQKMPRRPDRSRYTVKEFANELAKRDEVYILKLANHLTVIKDKNLYDTWNCSNKSVGNYWIIKNN